MFHFVFHATILITVRCPELCNPDNGYKFYTDTTVGSVATFGCLPDYELSDNEIRTCGGSGNWSSPSPVCTPVGKGNLYYSI